jgi:hypothetical protein
MTELKERKCLATLALMKERLETIVNVDISYEKDICLEMSYSSIRPWIHRDIGTGRDGRRPRPEKRLSRSKMYSIVISKLRKGGKNPMMW